MGDEGEVGRTPALVRLEEFCRSDRRAIDFLSQATPRTGRTHADRDRPHRWEGVGVYRAAEAVERWATLAGRIREEAARPSYGRSNPWGMGETKPPVVTTKPGRRPGDLHDHAVRDEHGMFPVPEATWMEALREDAALGRIHLTGDRHVSVATFDDVVLWVDHPHGAPGVMVSRMRETMDEDRTGRLGIADYVALVAPRDRHVGEEAVRPVRTCRGGVRALRRVLSDVARTSAGMPADAAAIEVTFASAVSRVRTASWSILDADGDEVAGDVDARDSRLLDLAIRRLEPKGETWKAAGGGPMNRKSSWSAVPTRMLVKVRARPASRVLSLALGRKGRRLRERALRRIGLFEAGGTGADRGTGEAA